MAAVSILFLCVEGKFESQKFPEIALNQRNWPSLIESKPASVVYCNVVESNNTSENDAPGLHLTYGPGNSLRVFLIFKNF